MAQITLNSSGVASNGSLLLQSNGTTTAVTIDASQNVGVGVTPSAWNSSARALQISGFTCVAQQDTGSYLAGFNFYQSTTGFRYLSTNPVAMYSARVDGSHAFFTAASGTAGNTISFTQAMTLDASGNLGIGTTSPASKLNVADSSTNCALTVTNSASNFQVQSNSNDGYLNLNGSGNIIFRSGTPSVNERARIDSSGNLLVGALTAGGSGINIGKQYGGVDLSGGGGSWANWGGAYGIFPYAGVGLGIATAAAIGFVGSTGTQIASINGTTGVYTALSDAGKKKDFEDSNVGLAEVLQLKPKLFRMLDDANDAPKQLGFIAQEVKLFVPQAYVENEIAEDQTFIGLQDRPIVAALVKAIQEQQAIIQTLTDRITALEQA